MGLLRGCCGSPGAGSSPASLQYRKKMDPQGPPDDVNDRHRHQHIEKVEIADTGKKDSQCKEPPFSSAEYVLRAQKQEGEPDHGVQKIRVAHPEQGKGAEHIDQGTCEISRKVLTPHCPAVPVEADPRQVHPQQDHGVVEIQHICLRHQDGREAEGISDDIVLQGRKQVRPQPHVEIEGRKSRLPCENTPQDRPAPSRVIAKRDIVLGEAVPLPDHALARRRKIPESQDC